MLNTWIYRGYIKRLKAEKDKGKNAQGNSQGGNNGSQGGSNGSYDKLQYDSFEKLKYRRDGREVKC